MQKPGTWLLYSGYLLVLTAICLYALFPTETMSRFLENWAAEAVPGCRVTFGSVKPALPPGLELTGIAATRGDQILVPIDRLRVSPGFATLFRKKPPLFLKGEIWGGIFDGFVHLESRTGGRLSRASLNLEDIALEKIAWLQAMAARNISGALTGKLLYERQSQQAPLRSGFKLTGLTVELRVPLFDVAAVVFKTVDVDLVMSRERLLVKRCVLAGQKMDGTISGSLNLTSPVEKSELLFTGVINIHPDFQEHLEKNLPEALKPKRKAERKGYPLRIFGTLDNPRFSLK